MLPHSFVASVLIVTQPQKTMEEEEGVMECQAAAAAAAAALAEVRGSTLTPLFELRLKKRQNTASVFFFWAQNACFSCSNSF